MADCRRAQQWFLRPANRHDVWASCVKVAARRRIECTRDLARKARAASSAAVLRAQHRYGGNQCLSVGVLRGCINRALLGDLDDLAEIHHRHPVRDVLHYTEVMRDEQIGEAELGLQILQQIVVLWKRSQMPLVCGLLVLVRE